MEKLLFSFKEINESWEKHNHYNHYLLDFYKNYEKNSCFPPGHYYSPIVNMDEVKSLEQKIFTARKEVPGVDLNEAEQLEMLNKLTSYYKEIPFKATKQDNCRYFFENDVFSYTDAIMLYSFIRYFQPKRIIEVGSGFSSALMLDTNNIFFKNSINLTFIEPYPERLNRLISQKDRSSCKIIEDKVQYVKVDLFQKLQAGDILFIDGSHVSKTGSDLNFLLFEVLPLLNKGVVIHFHDIFHPFEYPSPWVYEGRNWNEIYLVRALLTNNSNFKILMFNSFMHMFHSKSFEGMPDAYKNHGGSLWMVKNN